MNLKQYIADIEKLEKERYGMELTMNQITRKSNHWETKDVLCEMRALSPRVIRA